MTQITGLVAEIQHYSLQDGPGIQCTVFLKGCPLGCLWCHNPEMIDPNMEVWYKAGQCTLCGKCIEVCPTKAIKGYQDERVIDKGVCIADTGCRKCVRVCPTDALAVVGKEMAVEEVVEEVRGDAVFFRRSGGGACISGGEPSLQDDFAVEFLKQCQDNLINTSLETCAYASWNKLSRIVQYVDLILVDIKHMDPVKHKEGTGASNELILENIAKLAKMDKNMRVRLPLIPGYNDSEENLKKTAEFMVANNIKHIDLLPYHSFAENKYKRIGRKYEAAGIKEPTEEEMMEHKALLESCGLEVNIGGIDIEV